MKVLHLYEDIITPGDIAFLAKILREGKVLVFPTDTVPGLLADASNRDAVERIYEIKKRPKEKRFPVFVSNIDMAKELAQIEEQSLAEIENNWPGAYTYILSRIPYHQELFGVDAATIALRIPDYKPLKMLLEKVGIPLVQTSVNNSGEPALKNINDIKEYLSKQELKPDIIVNTGKTDHGKPSQIVDLTSADKRTIRN